MHRWKVLKVLKGVTITVTVTTCNKPRPMTNTDKMSIKVFDDLLATQSFTPSTTGQGTFFPGE
jgi:hypothetical protein